MHAPGAVTDNIAVPTPSRFIIALLALIDHFGVGHPLGSPKIPQYMVR
jgi:hypothetical protein